ncbi:hypothetical protein A6767_14435 [Aeromonas veronii]|nr:hypothetical protein A6767_14435 [Aeromonas veronii]
MLFDRINICIMFFFIFFKTRYCIFIVGVENLLKLLFKFTCRCLLTEWADIRVFNILTPISNPMLDIQFFYK